ncbi:hypothetical protein [Devosia insulae]|uniref:hypothetical protein n=1 Tax=Devosia insulae TaxID=408174 RepID=UPI00159EFCE1|nr:hypothetical protein [Devosia insulae]
MPKLMITSTERCCPVLADEAQLGWEAAAYLTLEAMQDGRIRMRRARPSPRSRR